MRNGKLLKIRVGEICVNESELSYCLYYFIVLGIYNFLSTMPYAKLRTNSKSVISVIHCTFSGLSVFVDPISFLLATSILFKVLIQNRCAMSKQTRLQRLFCFENDKKHLTQTNIHFWTKIGLKSSGCHLSQMIGI